MPDIPSIQKAPVFFAEATTLEVDTPCVICGYNLRGLTVNKVCPECGSPIGRSIHENMLRYADPKWLGHILLGVRLTLWHIVATIILVLLVALFTQAISLSQVYLIPAVIAVAMLKLLAAFLITAQEPKISMDEDTVTLRRVVRVCAAATFLGNCLDPISELLPDSLVVDIVNGVAGLLSIVASFGMFVYMRRFALRIPNKKLALSTKRCMWGFIITMAVGVVFGLLAAILGGVTGGTPGAGFAGIGIVACGVGAASLVFGIWYLVLLFDYRNEFRLAMERSRHFTG